MIGFDLDGVLVADVPYTDEIVPFRNLGMKALFIPTGMYAIITGRPNSEVDTTVWVERELSSNLPKYLFCSNENYRFSDVYKRDVLRDHPEIDIFVESDPSTALYLQREFPKRYIVHFSSWVTSALEMSIKEEA